MCTHPDRYLEIFLFNTCDNTHTHRHTFTHTYFCMYSHIGLIISLEYILKSDIVGSKLYNFKTYHTYFKLLIEAKFLLPAECVSSHFLNLQELKQLTVF